MIIEIIITLIIISAAVILLVKSLKDKPACCKDCTKCMMNCAKPKAVKH